MSAERPDSITESILTTLIDDLNYQLSRAVNAPLDDSGPHYQRRAETMARVLHLYHHMISNLGKLTHPQQTMHDSWISGDRRDTWKMITHRLALLDALYPTQPRPADPA